MLRCEKGGQDYVVGQQSAMRTWSRLNSLPYFSHTTLNSSHASSASMCTTEALNNMGLSHLDTHEVPCLDLTWIELLLAWPRNLCCFKVSQLTKTNSEDEKLLWSQTPLTPPFCLTHGFGPRSVNLGLQQVKWEEMIDSFKSCEVMRSLI